MAVNGVSIASGMVAGPLPDVAIIEINGFFGLWWGSLEAVKYTPVQKQDASDFSSVEALVNSDPL